MEGEGERLGPGVGGKGGAREREGERKWKNGGGGWRERDNERKRGLLKAQKTWDSE